MMEKYRHGLGNSKHIQRRVDIGRGRLIAAAEKGPRGRLDEILSMANPTLTRLLIAVAIAAAVLVTIAGCASHAMAPVNPNSIEIESIRLTAAGHYIDLRYRVLDAERANQVLGPGVKPLLIDEASGAVMAVPTTAKLGSLRQTRGEQRPDRSYFILFVNSAGLQSGSRVTAEIGDMKFESLAIE